MVRSYDRYQEFMRMNDPEQLRARFPDTPRGHFAARSGGRCPVHGNPLQVGPGYRSRMDLLPSAAFERFQIANPFCLDLGEHFEARPSTDPDTLIWCPSCVAAAEA
jgi:hypothetical protein